MTKPLPNSKYRTYILVGLAAVVCIYLGIIYVGYKHVHDEIKKTDTMLKTAMKKTQWDSVSLWDPAMQSYYSKNAPAALMACSDRIKKTADKMVSAFDQVKSDMETLAMNSDYDGSAKDYFFNKTDSNLHWKYNVASGQVRGTEIKYLVNATRENMLSVLDSLILNKHNFIKKESTLNTLSTEREKLENQTSLIAVDQSNADGNRLQWEVMYLEHSPVAGVIALLSKYQNDARRLEADMMVLFVRLLKMEEGKPQVL